MHRKLQCSDGKLYASAGFDCFSGEIIAPEKDAILPSEWGCEYTSYAFRRSLVSAGLVQSVSGTAHCRDNARMESFFAALKQEKLYQMPTYTMKRDEVKTIIFRYIFGYYNTRRITISMKVGFHL